ncbi:MAG: hypothetical protein C0601_11505 [Candidatus Muiribacterium halophilum]|uniref:Phosphatidate cytidylyltransferase n=1 Tax=Muiribacterium halophilum TaxID=2053465 RepID=A0A2N5ZBC8_MUIH1|nr:MAG: hypothetical protein C0601_11505 [Candidatus Muirbacterium halophilum]
MIIRALSSIIMVVCVSLLFMYLPDGQANVVFYILACIATFELAAMAQETYVQKVIYCIAWIPVFFMFDDIKHVIAYMYLVFFMGIWNLIIHDKVDLDKFFITSLYVLLTCLPFYMMSKLFILEKETLFAVLVMVWVYDIVAYIGGKNFGKHKLCVNISPKKSWEGLIIATIFVLVASYYTAIKTESFNVYDILRYAFLVVLLAPAGDLSVSILKRGFKIKDTGNIIPGHGGILDRLYSLIFLVPAIYIIGVL